MRIGSSSSTSTASRSARTRPRSSWSSAGLERTAGPVVVNVSTSRMVEDVAARFECPVYRSRVGEAHVIEAMKEHAAEVGFAPAGQEPL